jgi:hypothetical protein
MADQLPALAPCPHCGTAGEYRTDLWDGKTRYRAMCPNFDCTVGHKFFEAEAAAASWNRRATDGVTLPADQPKEPT